MKTIPLTRGAIATVDDEDFEWLSSFKWYALKSNRFGGRYYAVRQSSRRGDAKPRTIYMHREILGASPGVLVDHRDHDTLNNQRHNLRPATPSDNAANARRVVGESGFRGVRIDKRDGAFLVQVRGDSARFKNAEDAARAYDALAERHFGEFAKLNFPKATPLA
jgi:hypothetical protein